MTAWNSLCVETTVLQHIAKMNISIDLVVASLLLNGIQVASPALFPLTFPLAVLASALTCGL